jgi:hypothetical protein
VGFLLPSDASGIRRRDRWLGVLFALLLVFLVARASRKDGGVLVRNQEFGARFLAGEDPYFDPKLGSRIHGPYPPSYVLITAPLSLLPTPAARVAWGMAQALALFAAWRLARRWAREHWPAVLAHAPVAFAIALLLTSRFLLRDTAGGGGNLMLLVLAAWGLDFALRGRDAAGGALLALSLVLKPNLAPLLLFLAMRKRWKPLASTALFAAALFALPAAWFGVARYAELSSRWARDVAAYASLEDLRAPERIPDGLPLPDSSMNQSLREAVHRFLRPAQIEGVPEVHFAEVEPLTAVRIAQGLALLLAVASAFAAWRAREGRGALFSWLAFVPLCLLVSPITWKAHHVALLPLFFALASEALARRRWSALAAFLALYWLACDLASDEIVGRELRDRLQALSVVTWFDIALLAVALGLALDSDPAASVSRKSIE